MSTIKFKAGELLRYRGKVYLFRETLSLKEVMAEDRETGQRIPLPIAELESVHDLAAKPVADLSQIDSTAMEAAYKKFKAIEPLIKRQKRGDKIYLTIAQKIGRSVSTIYRWRDRYLKEGSVSALGEKFRGVKKGSKRLKNEVEEILSDLLDNEFLTRQKPSPTRIHESLRVALAQRGLRLRPAHINTIRARIAEIPEEKRTKDREGNEAAEQRYSENVGSLTADYPLEIVQVDHTKLNIMVVTDDARRLVIGRAWITVVFDVYSRVVLGFYISLDPPSALSVGLALVRAILPKENWLRSRHLKIEWPCWGKPSLIHADNGKDFRSETIKNACREHHIDIHWRPVKHPNWGGHIEAFMKTLSRMLKELPGATFDNPKERGKYDSEIKAAMTLDELERYIIVRILGVYHREVHSGIGMPPLKKWEQGLFKPETGIGIGAPERIVGASERKLRIDFLPFKERTIGSYGALIEGVHYYADVLSPYINARLPGKPRLPRKFVFRQDYRVAKFIWFWEEKTTTYHEIAARNLSFPDASVWELRKARERLRDQGKDPDNEALRRVFKPPVTGFWSGASLKCHDDNRTLGAAGAAVEPA